MAFKSQHPLEDTLKSKHISRIILSAWASLERQQPWWSLVLSFGLMNLQRQRQTWSHLWKGRRGVIWCWALVWWGYINRPWRPTEPEVTCDASWWGRVKWWRRGAGRATLASSGTGSKESFACNKIETRNTPARGEPEGGRGRREKMWDSGSERVVGKVFCEVGQVYGKWTVCSVVQLISISKFETFRNSRCYEKCGSLILPATRLF